MAKHAGRSGRPWKRIRAQVLAISTICALCGHDGADGADHVIPRAICIAMGRRDLLEDLTNLRPAHSRIACPVCGRHCNAERGTALHQRQPQRSRAW